MPDTCPVCGGPAIREAGEAVRRCIGIECKAVQLRNIVHFASKEGMDITGLGISIIERLIEKGLINDIADIYNLTTKDVASLKKNGQKFAANLIEAIEKSKTNDLTKLINAFGIRHTGSTTSKLLAKKYKTMNKLMNATYEELSLIEDIGPVIANSIYNFFKQEQTKDLIKKLQKSGVNMKLIQENIDNRFGGKTFVLTGTLEKYTREQAQDLIEKHGGKTSGTVSRKTSYVLAGEEAGSKIKKSQELVITIITEKEFNEIIG